ncbi:MAG: alpha/beta hydrolase [Pseudomonadota bacterium]
MSDYARVFYRDRTGSKACVAYLRQGKGRLVILVHGVGMQASVWKDQIDALSRHYDVIALDMLGHGESSLPPGDAGLNDYSDAVLALINHLGGEKAHLVGHSMGALVALEFALSHPERLISVTGMNAVFCRSEQQRAMISKRLSALDSTVQVDWNETIARWFGDPVPEHWANAAGRIEELLRASDPIGYARTYRIFATADEAHRDRLSSLQVPALFITGADDPNSLPQMSYDMASLTQNGIVEIIPNERHMMSVTAPELINARLLSFFCQAEKAQVKDFIQSKSDCSGSAA